MKAPLRTCRRSSALWLCTLVVIAFAIPALADQNRCVSVSGMQHGGFLQSRVVTTSFSSTTDGSSNTTFTYTFSGSDGTSVDGIPGLITYCVYPAEPPGNPNSTTANTGATPMDGNLEAFGADGEAFVQHDSAVGTFSWSRADGDPSNIAFDGNIYTMGSATWNAVSGNAVSPASQTILLHINDPNECSTLYGNGVANSVSTCWVFPNGRQTPPPSACNGNPACKTAQITDGNGNEFTALGNCTSVTTQPCVLVPMFTKLYIDYSYVIIDQTTNNTNLYTMTFKFPPSKTDINNGGGKDYFGCEQVPDPSEFPTLWGTYDAFATDTTGGTWVLTLTQGSGTCNQSRFTILPYTKTIVFQPNDELTFDVNMNTRANVGKGHKTVVYEYTTPGPHLLNSGFTVKWFQSAPDDSGNCAGGQQVWTSAKSLCSFSTSNTPIYVDAEQF